MGRYDIVITTYQTVNSELSGRSKIDLNGLDGNEVVTKMTKKEVIFLKTIFKKI